MIFIDTGAFLARFIERDQHHRTARTGWAELQKSNQRLFTSSFVVDEMITLLMRRTRRDFAVQKGRSLLMSKLLTIMRPGPDDEHDALGWLEKLDDQKLSFTDAISFSLMRREGIKRVFGFDRHFRQAGFELWP